MEISVNQLRTTDGPLPHIFASQKVITKSLNGQSVVSEELYYSILFSNTLVNVY